MGWGAMSASWATDSATAMSNAIRLALIVILIFAVFTALRTARDLVIVAWTFLTGAFLVSVVSIVTGSNKAGRLALGELDPNFLAASLAAALALAMFLVWGSSHRGVRLLLVVFMAMYGVAIVLTESRGALVALGMAVIGAAVFGGPYRGRILATIIVVAALGIGYYAILAPSEVRTRAVSTVNDNRDPRLDSWTIARRISEDHPVLGVGLGNFTVVEASYLAGQTNLFQARKLHEIPLVAHNTFLEILAELGVIGFALFLAVLVATIVPAVKSVEAISVRSAYAALTTRGLIVACLVLLTAYFFVSATYAKHLWLLLGILAAVTNVARSTTGSRTAD
jgi:O-antigen ligase